MYRIGVWGHFSSAHFLRNYKGKCERLHGHNWKVEVVLQGESLDKSGMLVDFGILKGFLKEVLEELDHVCLNDDIEEFKTVSPSSENIAKYVFFSMKKSLTGINADILETRVFESESTYAIYAEK